VKSRISFSEKESRWNNVWKESRWHGIACHCR
jgi:hypothetical protein